MKAKGKHQKAVRTDSGGRWAMASFKRVLSCF